MNDLANCYVNPVLQALHYVPRLRASVLMGHTCEREFCLTCELAFLSHMLAQPPTRGAGSHSASSAAAQPLNFLRTLRQVREAAALGLIEGRDELETRLDQSKPRRIQAFQRFLLEQLHKEAVVDARQKPEGPSKTETDAGKGKEKEKKEKAPLTAVESLFALGFEQKHSCAVCAREERRDARSFQIDLQYPEDKKDKATPSLRSRRRVPPRKRKRRVSALPPRGPRAPVRRVPRAVAAFHHRGSRVVRSHARTRA